MTAQDYSTKFVVDRTPEQAFLAITRVRDWWPEIEGSAVKIGDTFKHRFQDMHRCELVVKDMIPSKKSLLGCVERTPQRHIARSYRGRKHTGTSLIQKFKGGTDEIGAAEGAGRLGESQAGRGRSSQT